MEEISLLRDRLLVRLDVDYVKVVVAVDDVYCLHGEGETIVLRLREAETLVDRRASWLLVSEE